MIIAIDPGGTTGIAVLDETGKVRMTAAVRAGVELRHAVDVLVKDGADVVIEKGVSKGLLELVERYLASEFPDATWVQPGVWKTSREARSEVETKGLTRHERDAIRLGRYHLARIGRTS